MRLAAVCALIAALAGLPARATGQAASTSSRSIQAVRAPKPPAIDGSVEEAEWAGAPVAGSFTDPFTGRPAPDQTEAFLLYDADAIYVAFRCHDSRPAEIVAREIRYGTDLTNEDTVSFQVDPYYNRTWECVSQFQVNALGTQTETVAGGRAAKREWRGVWQAAAKRTADGWSAEMRIPWSMLTCPAREGPCKVGINLSRYQARTKINAAWSDVTLTTRPELIGVWDGVVLPRARRRVWQGMVYAAPEWQQELNGRPFLAGGDVRYTPNPQLTGVMSVLPDFRNVEQAVEGIQFSRSERYLQETRPFFVEGADYLPWLFYSPRVADFDAGFKAFGKPDAHVSFGVLSVFRGLGYNASAGQVRYVMGPHGSASLYGTLRRSGEPSHDAFGGSVGGRTGNWSLSTTMSRAREGSTAGNSIGTDLVYRVPHYMAALEHVDCNPGYSPSLGYSPFVGLRGFSFYNSYGNEFRHGFVREWGVAAQALETYHYGGAPFQRNIECDIGCTTRRENAYQIRVETGTFDQGHDRVIRFATAGNVTDRYRRWDLSYEVGTRSDQPIRTCTFGVTRRLFGRVDLGLSSTVVDYTGTQQQHIATLGWEINARQAITGRVVRTGGHTNAYLAYRNSNGLGHELYVILGDPNAERFSARISLKWVAAL